jgi:16S rRNA processing protein RimM
MANKKSVEIATIGKVVGLGGELKLHLQTDFISQLKRGAKFYLKNGKTVEIEHYNETRGLVKFFHYNVREDAALLTNQKLYLSEEESRKNCQLDENQHFWFDLVGAEVLDDGVRMGEIEDIERIANTDYLKISTDKALIAEGHVKSFYIPYIIDVYIDHFNEENKILYTKEARSLLEAS